MINCVPTATRNMSLPKSKISRNWRQETVPQAPAAGNSPNRKQPAAQTIVLAMVLAIAAQARPSTPCPAARKNQSAAKLAAKPASEE